MTTQEIRNTPEIVDFMLDKSVITDSRIKLYKRLEEICELAIKALEQEPCETIKEIPKDYKYDTETKDFLVYRHMYTGHEIHIEKPVPRYRIEQQSCEDCISRQAAKSKAVYSLERHEKVVPVAELDWLPPVEPEKCGDCISRQAAEGKLKKVVDEMALIFADIREKNVDDSVCGLCEYDCDHGIDGCANECLGFERNDCFKLKEQYRKEWADLSDIPSVEPEREPGKWLSTIHHCRRWMVCSQCGAEHIHDRFTEWNYCLNCGAKMEENPDNVST